MTLFANLIKSFFNIVHAPHLYLTRNEYHHSRVGSGQGDQDHVFLPLALIRALYHAEPYFWIFSKMLVVFRPCTLYSGAPYNPSITGKRKVFCKRFVSVFNITH